MLIIFTGDGKGKTTAALGCALRAIGAEKKVLMIQFLKSPAWPSSEEKVVKRLPNFKIVRTGLGFFEVGLPRDVRLRHLEAAKKGLEFAKKEISLGKWDLVVLDEICVALNLKLLDIKDVIALIKYSYKFARPPGRTLGVKADCGGQDSRKFARGQGSDIDIILTGRNCPRSLIKIADLVTEMEEIKHPHKKGIRAKPGLDF